MKLSIITINRNNALGLHKTIESVFVQTYPDFEYIVVDGASTDDSLITIQQFDNSATRRFYWLSEPDAGVFNAMNKGIRMAKGEYILFLNSGDFLVDNQVLNNVFSMNHTSDLLCGRCRVSDEGKVIWTSDPPKEFSLNFFFHSTLAHQATFIKRTLFDKYGLYREDLKLMSDWEFWLRTIILGNVTDHEIDIIISDYNLDGISSKKENKISAETEKKKVFIELGLSKIIIDYKMWQEEQERMKVMYWVKSKPVLYQLLTVLYNMAVYRHGLSKGKIKA